MTTWLVSRHPGAVHWLRRRGFHGATHVRHLDTTDVTDGDTVIGTLPVAIVAELAARGVAYYHLVIPIPAHRRGCELAAGELDALGTKLIRYTARALDES